MEVLIDFVDKDKDGYIEYDEFISAFKPKQMVSVNRDLLQCQKRPISVSKET